MTWISRLSTVILILALAAALVVPQLAASPDEKPGLFVNLTTDDTWSAAMAVHFAHDKVLKQGHTPVTVFLNVRGIYHAHRERPSHSHGLVGQSIQEMLAAFIADGGQVLACPTCLKAAGMQAEDLLAGVRLASTAQMETALFGPDVRTLTW